MVSCSICLTDKRAESRIHAEHSRKGKDVDHHICNTNSSQLLHVIQVPHEVEVDLLGQNGEELSNYQRNSQLGDTCIDLVWFNFHYYIIHG